MENDVYQELLTASPGMLLYPQGESDAAIECFGVAQFLLATLGADHFKEISFLFHSHRVKLIHLSRNVLQVVCK